VTPTSYDAEIADAIAGNVTSLLPILTSREIDLLVQYEAVFSQIFGAIKLGIDVARERIPFGLAEKYFFARKPFIF
jgi:hypothetical protein